MLISRAIPTLPYPCFQPGAHAPRRRLRAGRLRGTSSQAGVTLPGARPAGDPNASGAAETARPDLAAPCVYTIQLYPAGTALPSRLPAPSLPAGTRSPYPQPARPGPAGRRLRSASRGRPPAVPAAAAPPFRPLGFKPPGRLPCASAAPSLARGRQRRALIRSWRAASRSHWLAAGSAPPSLARGGQRPALIGCRQQRPLARGALSSRCRSVRGGARSGAGRERPEPPLRPGP